MPPKGISVVMRRELDTHFQENSEFLERMMQRLEVLNNQALASPELIDVVVVED